MSDAGELQKAWGGTLFTARPEPSPHYLGHRDRLRDRARAGRLGALPDYEFLELCLFRTIPRGDVKPLAKALIARLGSLAGVLGAILDELKTVRGVGETVALGIKLLQEAALRVGKAAVVKRTVISSSSPLSA